MMDSESSAGEGSLPPAWQPLSAIERRIVGVLVEKAKTTPDQYPMSLNALTNGCNQKSNRAPLMNLEPDDVEEALSRLRQLGSVAEVTGGGRVTKYRHYMKDWLGVDGNELAVMAELLLRGPQTVGQLRGRAARMSPIPDLSALRPVLQDLETRGLIGSLTPEGRGQIVTHRLYYDQEFQKLLSAHGSSAPARRDPPLPDSSPLQAARPPAATESSATELFATEAPATSLPSTCPASAAVGASAAGAAPVPTAASAFSVSDTSPRAGVVPSHNSDEVIAELRGEIAELRGELSRLRKEVEDLWANFD